MYVYVCVCVCVCTRILYKLVVVSVASDLQRAYIIRAPTPAKLVYKYNICYYGRTRLVPSNNV